jgi:hypothetical protein
MKTYNTLREFVAQKREETIRTYVVAFHQNDTECLGRLRVDKNLQNVFNLENNKTYNIYLKLKTPLSDCTTRVILTKISEHYNG